MKTIVLFLSALMVAPVWAGEAVVAKPAPVASAASAAAPTSGHSVYVEIKGAPKSVRALIGALEADAVYKDASCVTLPASKSGKSAGVACAKADSALMSSLGKNASADVSYSLKAAACATGCSLMACPPPGGPTVCCKKTSLGYKPC